FFFSSRRRHTRWPRDWSSDVCSSDLGPAHLERSLEDHSSRRFVTSLLATLAETPHDVSRIDDGVVDHGGEGDQQPRDDHQIDRRSEERRVGKECRCRWWAYIEKKKGK